MPDTVTAPGGLKVNKKVAIGIGIAAVAIAGFYYYRQRQAANAATSSANTAASSNSSIDPQTGYAYGSPEDQAALAAMSGSTLGQYNSAAYAGGSVVGYDQYGNPIYGTGGNPSGQPGSFTNNAQWTQAAESLMGSSGADAIAAALGKYLTGQQMTDDQVTIIQEAIASQGYPPVSGPDGFPPSYHTIPTPPPVQGGGTIKLANVVGEGASAAKAKLRAQGLSVTDLPREVPKGHTGKVTGQSPKAGTMVSKGSTVSLSLQIK